MAKKRLNKKVALIGFLVFIVFALAATATILYLSRDPAKYAKDGDVAFAAKNYTVAEHSYLKARALSKNDDFRVKMLFKLVDLFIETDKWRNVLGCWNEIVRLDPKNVKARYGRLRYFYTMANAGAKNVWSEIDLQASQFIEVSENEKLLDENTGKWETIGLPKSEIAASRLGAYIYLVRGRALLEKARLGAVTDPEELFSHSIGDLEKVLQLEPNNIDAYWYLAQAHIARGEVYASKGNLEGKTKALEDAKELLEKPLKAGNDSLQAHINLLAMKPVISQMSDREQFKALEPEYLSLVEKFNSDAKAHSVLSVFYSNTGYKNLDKAITQIGKAVELDKENVEYAMSATNLYYRKFSIFGDKDALRKAITIAKDALQFPGAKETKGPQQWINKRSSIWLNSFLVRSYVEQILGSSEPVADVQKQELIADAEKAVHEIEQLYGSGEDPIVVKWQGMLELGRGNRDTAIRKLVPTYEQLKASGQRDSYLAYTLAKLFENSDEVGSAADFLGDALSITDRNVSDKIDDSKPDALLDYAALLIKLRAYTAAVNMVDYFENEYWVKPRSRAIRMEAYIGARQFDEVQKELAKENPEDPNTIKLNILLTKAKMEQIRAVIMRRRMAESSDILQQLMKRESAASAGAESQVQNEANSAVSLKAMSDELYGYVDSLSQLTGKLLAAEPNSVKDTAITLVCDNYISQQARWNDARILVDKYLEHFPHNTTVLVYKKILSAPEPNNISNQKRRQIEQEVISEISDPVARSMYLGAYFQRNGEPNNAVEEYKKVLGITPLKEKATNEPVFGTVENPTEIHRMAASSLADIAFKTRNIKLAEQIADVGKRGNLDGCDGQFFGTLVLLIKQDYKAALVSVDACLKQRPIFSYAHMLRSNINSLLGNETASIADIQKAASMNPLDGAIAKMQANVLFQRNRKLGDNATSEQVLEAKTAIDRAMALNPNDIQLLGFYAEYISDTDPMRALAIRQMLQKTVPSTENAFQLGRMAMRVAEKQTDNTQKEALQAIAESSFQQALVYEPANKVALEGMANYYRITGQEKKAEDLLTQSQEPKLLWRHFVLAGQLDKAKQLLLQLYVKEPNNKDTLTGLLSIAQSSSDRQAASKYSDELIKIEDSSETRLLQIQVFLTTGLIKEAESKLQSFKEKYPNDPRGMQLGGWLAMKQGRLPEALKLINKDLELNQDNADVWQLRGEINYLMANYDQAVADFKKSKGLADKPEVRISLAKGLLRIGRGEDALTELENILDDPKAPVEGALLLEEVYSKIGKRQLLVDMYRKVLKNYPDNLLWYDRAGKYALSVSDFNSATSLYEKGWQKSNETDKDMLDGYLQALLASGKTDKAIEVAGKYVDSNNIAIVALYRIADAKMKLGNKTEAIQYCRKAVEKASNNENASTWVLEKMNSLVGQEEVLSVCKEKLQANPNSPSANFAMFNVMRLNGEYNKALEYIDKCVSFVALGSDSEIELKMRKVEILQLAYIKTADNNYRQSAIKEYESLLTKVPNNADVLNNLAYMLAESNERIGEALDYAKRAHETSPNDAGFMDTYAYLLYKNKKYSEAAELSHASVQQYEQGKATVPYDVYEHLGMIKQALGQKEEARNAYQQALDAGGNTLPNATRERIKVAIEQVSN